MAAGDLTTLASIEQYLGLQSGNEDEALLSALITALSAAAGTYCSREFTSQAVTETRDGRGERRMPFLQNPATAVSSLVIDGQTIPAGDPFQTPGYYFTSTMLMLTRYCFCRGLGNVTISYTAGYATIPADLAQAINEWVALRYREIGHLDKSSEGLPNMTTAYLVKDMRPSTQLVLDRYKRVVLG